LRYWREVGFYPEMNIPFGVDELAMYDPIIPQSYFDAWPVPNAAQVSHEVDLFSPDIDTVALAHRYGVSYVLALPGEKAPPGMRRVATAADEALYVVAGSSQFSFVPSGMRPAAATVISTSHPADNRYVVQVAVAHTTRLAVRITDVSGWHAYADGRPLPIDRYDGGLLRVEVPKGTHTVELNYWPKELTEGLLLAGAAMLGLILWALWCTGVGRRRATSRSSRTR
jgi:hypothetical protein